MKKLFLAFIVVSGLAIAADVSSCKPGNTMVHIEERDEIACCVMVGDGSELSCTNGEDWYNHPNED